MPEEPDAENTCFIIAPIGEDESKTRERTDTLVDLLIRPAVAEFNLIPVVAHRMRGSGSIPSEIIESLIKSKIVIADLTEGNPNVFYELAVRHLTEKPCIHMISEGFDIPFDIHSMRTIRYNSVLRNSPGIIEQIKETIRYFETHPLKENPFSSKIREIGGNRLLTGLHPGVDSSAMSFVIDSNMDVLDGIYQTLMEIKELQWLVSHPNIYESRRSEEFFPTEQKMIKPSALDFFEYKQMKYNEAKDAGATEADLIPLKIEMYQEFLEWKKDWLQQKAYYVDGDSFPYP